MTLIPEFNPRRPMTTFALDDLDRETINRQRLQDLTDAWNKHVTLLGQELATLTNTTPPGQLKWRTEEWLIPKAEAYWGEHIFDYQAQLFRLGPADCAAMANLAGLRYSREQFINAILLYADRVRATAEVT